MQELWLRPAVDTDLDDVVALHARSRAVALPFLPILHSLDEDRAFFGAYITAKQMTLALAGLQIIGFMAQSPGWIEQLYLDPDWRGQGVGDQLIDQAKSGADALKLWCFAENTPACRFYQRHGFIEKHRTDGDNEAGLPDILYRWSRAVRLNDAQRTASPAPNQS